MCDRADPSHLEHFWGLRKKANELGYGSIATAALAAWEWLQREEHLFGAFEVKHYRPPSGLTACMSSTLKRARKLGRRSLTKQSDRSSQN
jgi:hypothetical protein